MTNDSEGLCNCRKIYGTCKYVNGNRTNKQKRARYCFLRHIGYSRKETRLLMGYSDSRVIRYLQGFTQ
jgi:hypothetical protein